jgi:hypothetical protein
MSARRGRPSGVGGEGGYQEMLEVDGKEPDVSWTSRRNAMESGYSDDLLARLGSERAITLRNREVDRLKVIDELVRRLLDLAEAQGLSLCLGPPDAAEGPGREELERLKRWVRDIR